MVRVDLIFGTTRNFLGNLVRIWGREASQEYEKVCYGGIVVSR